MRIAPLSPLKRMRVVSTDAGHWRAPNAPSVDTFNHTAERLVQLMFSEHLLRVTGIALCALKQVVSLTLQKMTVMEPPKARGSIDTYVANPSIARLLFPLLGVMVIRISECGLGTDLSA